MNKFYGAKVRYTLHISHRNPPRDKIIVKYPFHFEGEDYLFEYDYRGTYRKRQSRISFLEEDFALRFAESLSDMYEDLRIRVIKSEVIGVYGKSMKKVKKK